MPELINQPYPNKISLPDTYFPPGLPFRLIYDAIAEGTYQPPGNIAHPVSCANLGTTPLPI